MATPHRTSHETRRAGAAQRSRSPGAAARSHAGPQAHAGTALAHAELPVWAKLRADGSALVLTLHVQPGARASGPAGRHGEALKVRIAAPATDNKANEALAAFLQRSLGVARDAVRITQGRSSRRKVVEIVAAPESLCARLGAWDRGAEE